MIELDPQWHYAESPGRQHYLLKAKLGRHVIGRAHGWYASQDRFVIEKIEIDRAYRSQGHGKTMIAALLAYARSQQCEQLAFTGVMRKNEGAILLYRTLGAEAGPYSNERCDFVLRLA